MGSVDWNEWFIKSKILHFAFMANDFLHHLCYGHKTHKKIFMRFYADIDKYLRNRIALPFTSSWKIRCISLTICFQRWESNEVKHFAKVWTKYQTQFNFLFNIYPIWKQTIPVRWCLVFRMFAQENWRNWHLICCRSLNMYLFW